MNRLKRILEMYEDWWWYEMRKPPKKKAAKKPPEEKIEDGENYWGGDFW